MNEKTDLPVAPIIGSSVTIPPPPEIDVPRDDFGDRALNVLVDDPAVIKTLRGILNGIAEIVPINTNSLAHLKGKPAFALRVTDREKFLSPETLKALIPIFGKMIYDIFKTDEAPDFETILEQNGEEDFIQSCFLDGDLECAETIYLIPDREKLSAFMMTKDIELDNGETASYVLLNKVSADSRGKGLCKALYEMAYADQKAALVGISHTPAAIKDRVRSGANMGYTTYFASHRHGDSSLPLNEKERAMIASIERSISKDTSKYGYASLQAGIPPHYVNYGKEGIPPRTMEEIKFREDDPLGLSLRELVQWQQLNRPRDCIYGTLITLRNDLVGLPD